MKKQINPTIKAHLIRGAFYLLLLVAVCAIPFALAQRNKLSSAKGSRQARRQSAANEGPRCRRVWESLSVGRAGRLAGRAAARNPASGQNALPYDVRVAPSLPRMSKFLSAPVAFVPRTCCRFRERRKLRRWSYTIRDDNASVQTPLYRSDVRRRSGPSAPIWLTISSFPEVRLGMWSRSTPMGFISTARDRPSIGMCSFTPTTVVFPARKFTAR